MATFKADENPGKPLLRHGLMNAVRPAIASNENPYLHMTFVSLHSTSEMEKEENHKSVGHACLPTGVKGEHRINQLLAVFSKW